MRKMKRVPVAKNGVVTIPVSDAKIIAGLLRHYEEIIGAVVDNSKKARDAQWYAYCFEQCKGDPKYKTDYSKPNWRKNEQI